MPSTKYKLPRGAAWPVRYSDLVGALQEVVDEEDLYATFDNRQAYDEKERAENRQQGVWHLAQLTLIDAETDAAQEAAAREDRPPCTSISVRILAVPQEVLRASAVKRELLADLLREQVAPLLLADPRIHQRRVTIVLDAPNGVIRCEAFGTDVTERQKGGFRPTGEVVVQLPQPADEGA